MRYIRGTQIPVVMGFRYSVRMQVSKSSLGINSFFSSIQPLLSRIILTWYPSLFSLRTSSISFRPDVPLMLYDFILNSSAVGTESQSPCFDSTPDDKAETQLSCFQSPEPEGVILFIGILIFFFSIAYLLNGACLLTQCLKR